MGIRQISESESSHSGTVVSNGDGLHDRHSVATTRSAQIELPHETPQGSHERGRALARGQLGESEAAPGLRRRVGCDDEKYSLLALE
jgi:hypothetical protein